MDFGNLYPGAMDEDLHTLMGWTDDAGQSQQPLLHSSAIPTASLLDHSNIAPQDDGEEYDEDEEDYVNIPGALGSAERKRQRQSIDKGPIQYPVLDAINLKEVATTLLNTILADNSCKRFLSLPQQKLVPELYEAVPNLIDLYTVQEKLNEDKYTTLEQFEKDVLHAVDCWKAIHKHGMTSFKQSSRIRKLYAATKEQLGLGPVPPCQIVYLGPKSDPPTGTAPKLKKPRTEHSLLDAFLDDGFGDGMSSSPKPLPKIVVKPPVETTRLEADATEDFQATFNATIDDICQITDHTGRYHYELFEVLPTPEELPDYYEIITNPIDIREIRRRVNSGYYKTPEMFDADMNLMFNNATTYNEQGSMVYEDARALREAYRKSKKRAQGRRARRLQQANANGGVAALANATTATPPPKPNRSKPSEGGSSARARDPQYQPPPAPYQAVPTSASNERDVAVNLSAPGDEELMAQLTGDAIKRACQAIYDAIATTADTDGRLRAELFMKLPTRKELPEYYMIIHDPIDMEGISHRIQTDFYTTFAQFEADVTLMLKNAFTYNMEGSQVYEDTKVLRETYRRVKRKQLKSFDKQPVKEKLVTMRFTKRGGEVTLLEPEVFRELDQSDRKAMRKGFRIILQQLQEYKDANGVVLSELLMTPPTTAENPRYHQIVEEAIGIGKVVDRLKRSKYTNISRFVLDLYRVFDNTICAFDPATPAHIAARTLKTLFTELRKANLSPAALANQFQSTREERYKPEKDSGVVDTPYACRTAYKALCEARDENNQELAEVFRALPARDKFPDYYYLIADPIDLNIINVKLRNNEYLDYDAFDADCELMINNCLVYYPEGTRQHSAALAMQQVLHRQKKKLLPRVQTRVLLGSTLLPINAALDPDYALRSACELILHEISACHDAADGRVRAQLFFNLPDMDASVARRLDLNVVQLKVKRSEYSSFEQFETDLLQAISNAVSHHGTPTVQDDAKTLVGIFNDGKRKHWTAVVNGVQSTASAAKPRTPATALFSATLPLYKPPAIVPTPLSTMPASCLVTHISATETQYVAAELFQALDEALKSQATNVNRVRMSAPAPTEAPEYYLFVSEPTDLSTIRARVETQADLTLNQIEGELKRWLAVQEAWNRMMIPATAKDRIQRLQSISDDVCTIQRVIDEKLAILAQRSRRVPTTADDEPLQTSLRARYSLLRGFSAGVPAAHIIALPRHDPNFQDVLEQAVEVVDLADVQVKLACHTYNSEQAFERDVLLAINLGRLLFPNAASDEYQALDNLDAYFRTTGQIMLPKGEHNVALPGWRTVVKVSKNISASQAFMMGAAEWAQSGGVIAEVPAVARMHSLVAQLDGPVHHSGLSVSQIMLHVFNTLLTTVDERGRRLCERFWELPSREKDKNNYYFYVKEPISLGTIYNNLVLGNYVLVDTLAADILRVFVIARRLFNPKSSEYADAATLEAAIVNVLCEFAEGADEATQVITDESRVPSTCEDELKIGALLQGIVSFRNVDQRVLFDYLDKGGRTEESIMDPSLSTDDLAMVIDRARRNHYVSAVAFLTEVIRVLEANAEHVLSCVNSYPDAVRYCDAVTLLEAVRRHARLLHLSVVETPSINSVCNALLDKLVEYREPERKRQCALPFLRLPTQSELPEYYEIIEEPVDIQMIRDNIEKDVYGSFLEFERDVFLMFSNARRFNQPNSYPYFDSQVLQFLYVQERNEVLVSEPPLTNERVEAMIGYEQLRALSLSVESTETLPKLDQVQHDGVTYAVGDYVYLDLGNAASYRIMYVENILLDADGSAWLSGLYYYRPAETHHVASKVFHAKEVFRGYAPVTHRVQLVRGRCLVMHTRDYVTLYTPGFNSEDVYHCESRYNEVRKAFVAMKTWEEKCNVHTAPRSVEIDVKRDTLSGEQNGSERALPCENVVLPPAAGLSGADSETIRYSVYFYGSTPFSLGDVVYLRSLAIVRITEMKSIPSLDGYNTVMQGCVMKRPCDTVRPRYNKYYSNELLQTTESIQFSPAQCQRKCVLISPADFARYFPADYSAFDTFIGARQLIYNADKSTQIVPLSTADMPKLIGPRGVLVKRASRQAEPSLYLFPGEPYVLPGGGTSGERIGVFALLNKLNDQRGHPGAQASTLNTLVEVLKSMRIHASQATPRGDRLASSQNVIHVPTLKLSNAYVSYRRSAMHVDADQSDAVIHHFSFEDGLEQFANSVLCK